MVSPEPHIKVMLKPTWEGVDKIIEQGTAVLVVSPYGQGEADDVEQLGIAFNAHRQEGKVAAFFVAGVPGTDRYELFDLNRLPIGVEVTLSVKVRDTTTTSIFKADPA